MTRLSAYLTRLFASDAAALFGVAALLLFLVQCLRTFDVVSVRGQDIPTLIGQALLTMPTLGIAFIHVCVGIGLARGLRTLQQTQELHIIHSSRRTSALVGAVVTFAFVGALLVLLLTNFLEPATKKYYNAWSASIAADLVGRTLTPHRFVEITPGVTLVIGSRDSKGELGSFFADDRRAEGMRRTYMANEATVASDDQGYVLQLRDGAIQYMDSDRQFSEISFSRYDLAVERLTGSADAGFDPSTYDTLALAVRAQESGQWGVFFEQLGNRLGEGFRVIAICLFVAALAAFPHGRRNPRELPIEIVVLAAAFFERAISTSFASPVPLLPVSGSILVAVVSLIVLAFRFEVFKPVRRAEFSS